MRGRGRVGKKKKRTVSTSKGPKEIPAGGGADGWGGDGRKAEGGDRVFRPGFGERGFRNTGGLDNQRSGHGSGRQ